MSFDYDGFNEFFPETGNIASSVGLVSGDGTEYTTQFGGNFRQCTVIATWASAVAYSALGWTLTESYDGSTYTALANAADAVYRFPANTALTTKAAHVSYVGKAPYFQAVLTGASSPAYCVLYGKPTVSPTIPMALGVDDGVYTTNPPS